MLYRRVVMVAPETTKCVAAETLAPTDIEKLDTNC